MLLAAAALSLSAQTALTGSITGQVQDASGGALAGAELTLRSPSLASAQTVSSGAGGAFRFVRLAPGHDYQLTAASPQFAAWRRDGLTVHSGESLSVKVELQVLARRDIVEIRSDTPALSLESTEIGSTTGRTQLNELPTNGRLLNRFALLNAHVRNPAGLGGDASNATRLSINGAIFRDTQYRLDGNTNYDTLFNNAPLQRLSLSAVQEFRVLTSQFNAEHGSTATGVVITTTRSGTDEFHGEALFFARPSGIQSRPPLSSLRTPNQLLQGGASLGGPVLKERTYFFANYERLAQDRGSFIQSPAPDVFVGALRDNLALAKLDHRFTDRHWLSLRLNGQRESNTNANDRVGGLLQASAANKSLAQSIGTQLTDTTTWGSVVNEVRLGYTNAVPSNTVPLSPQVGIIRPGFSSDGASSFTMIRNEVYQAADQLSWQKGPHSFKFGGDFIRRKVRDFAYDQFGSYTFAGGVPVPGELPLQFTQRFGVNRIRYGQTQWAAFAQDTWRLHPRLTLNLGLRYDYQSLLDDYNNLGPRFGLAWDVTGSGSTVIRAGGGLYYDQPFFHGLTQRFLQNGLDAPFVSFTFTPGMAAFPQFPASLDAARLPAGLTAAPRNIVQRANQLLSPYTSQFTFGIERRVVGDWIFSANVIRSLTVKQFIHYNRNAPAPFARTAPGQTRSVATADATRPLFDAARGVSLFQGVAIRDLRETVNGGIGNYHALDMGISRRFAGRYQLQGHYVWSSAINTVTDDHLGANPNEWSNAVKAERALSDFAQRHRFVGSGLVRLPWGLQFAATATIGSGLPVNAVTGADNNGDTTVVDRPAGMGRNTFRGTPHRSLDVSLVKTVALGEKSRLELRGDAFNISNNQNYYRFNNVYGNGAAPAAAFLRPIGGVANVDPARQFTFGAKFVF